MMKEEQIHKKQIETKKEELSRMIRLYLIGCTNAKMVRNALQCLFTDIFLDKTTYETEEQLNLGYHRGNFEKFMREMME